MLEKIPILKSLRYREKQAGKDVTLQDEHSDLANANTPAASNEKATAESTRPKTAIGSAQTGQHHVESDSLSPRLEESSMITTVYVGNIPPSVRVSELKCALREFQATPLRLNWQGAQHKAFLDYKDQATAESAVSSLKGLSLGGKTLRVELAKNQRSKGYGEIKSHKLIWIEGKKKEAWFLLFCEKPTYVFKDVSISSDFCQLNKEMQGQLWVNEVYISQLSSLPHFCSCASQVDLSRQMTEGPFP